MGTQTESRKTSPVSRWLGQAPLQLLRGGRILSNLQLLIAATVLIALSAVSVATVHYARSRAADELIERGATVSSLLARSAARALNGATTAEEAIVELERVIYDVRAEQDIEYVFVCDRDGRALVHSDSRKIGKLIFAESGERPATQPKTSLSDEGFRYSVASAQEDRNISVYGFVRDIRLSTQAAFRHGAGLELHIGFSLPGFWPFMASGLQSTLPGLALGFLLLVVGNYLAGVFIKPLDTLRAETGQAAQAQDDWQLQVDAGGEVAEIAENWNLMVQNFQASYENVVEARREMEVRNRVMLYEKKRTESIVDSLTDGVMVTDAYGKISFVNRELENMLGIEREQAVMHRPQDVLKDEELTAFMDSVILPLSGGAGEASETTAAKRSQRKATEVEIQRASGARHIRAVHVPVLDKGRPSGGITTFRDVTQQRLEEQARKEFVSSVTHELRAPLTAIKSYVEMLIDDEAKDPELQREFFNTINEEADRLARLINDMLNMSKIEVGNLVLNKSLVRTRKLVEDAVNGLRSSAAGKSIELTASISPKLPDIEADKEMVRVVITNLLGNGIKYTPEGGRVLLSVEHVIRPDQPNAPGVIALTVEDSGPGIPEDEIDKIFEKFYRGRATQGQKVVGNGLGLPLAREIATLHGGEIQVASTVGQGSKFTFLLPAVETSRKVS